jgi:large-conductance mechanosensitive channel
MIGFILPWKYSFQGGVIDFSSKINTAVQYLLLCIIPFLVLANLLHEWDEAKKSKNEHKFKAALRQWWSGF